MKYLIFLLFSFTILFSVEKTTNLKIDGMMCNVSCPNAIKKSIKNINGIKACNIEFDTKTAIVTYDDSKIDVKTIARTIEEKTYFKVNLPQKEKKKSLFNWLFNKK